MFSFRNGLKMPIYYSVSSLATTSKKAQRAIGFRVDEALYDLIAAAASRQETTPSDYCRELISTYLRKPREEDTTAGVYHVALKTLEDLTSFKDSIFYFMLSLFSQQAADTALPEDKKEKLIAGYSEEDRKRGRVPNRGELALSYIAVAENAKRTRVRRRLLEP